MWRIHVASWIRYATPTPPAPVSARPSWPAETASSQQFDVTLERVAAGRPERSMVLSGLRGVGKTVLLNALRGQAVKRAWGTGKIEARPDQSLRLPLAQAVHAAVREVAHRHRDPERVDAVAGVLKSFALRTPLPDRKGIRWQPPGRRARRPRAAPTPATSSSTWSSCSPTWPTWPATSASGSASSSTRCRTSPRPSSPRSAGPATRSASRARRWSSSGPACRTCRSRWPRASPTPSGCSGTSSSTGCRGRWPTGPCSCRPAPRTSTTSRTRSTSSTALTDGYPYFVQAYGKVTWDAAVASPIGVGRRRRGRARGGAGARGRLLRRPLRPGHPGRARLHARDGRARRRQRRRRR